MDSEKTQECVYDGLQGVLMSLLGTDDVLTQFLTADGPLEEPDLNGPTTLHCEICKKQFDNAKKYYGHLRVHSKDNLWICGMYILLAIFLVLNIPDEKDNRSVCLTIKNMC